MTRSTVKRLLAISVVCAAVFAAYGQTPATRTAGEAIFTPDPTYSYRALMERYVAGDTTLDARDYDRLYYGYALEESYRPHEPVPARDRMLVALSRGGLMTAEERDRAIELGRQVLASDPFCLSTINCMTYLYTMQGDRDNALRSGSRFAGIVGAIRRSGTGLSEDSPFQVLSPGHGRDLVTAGGGEIRQTYAITNDVVYLMLRERDAAGNRGYYFDNSRANQRAARNTGGRRVEGLEVNGIKIKKR